MTTVTDLDREVLSGQAVYTKRLLMFYDLFVIRFSNRFVWRCPASKQLYLYHTFISDNHLEVGVGSGFFLDRCGMPKDPRIVLVDLNPNSLEKAAQRIHRYQPSTFLRNALEPLDLEGEQRFDSIGINYLLHCVPGDFREKATIFDHLKSWLNPGGIMFGSTLPGSGVNHGPMAHRFMEVYNRKGVFHNVEDRLEDLHEVLKSRFPEYGIEVCGSVALFWARQAS